MKSIQRELVRLKGLVSKLGKEKYLIYISIPLTVMGLIYLVGKFADNKVQVFHKTSELSFAGGKVLNNNGKSLYKRKEKIFSKKFQHINTKMGKFDERFDKVNESLNLIKEALDKKTKLEEGKSKPPDSQQTNDVTFGMPANDLTANKVSPKIVNGMKVIGSGARKRNFGRKIRGPSIISFPVQTKNKTKLMTVKLPPGSFLRAKLLTGVEAPEGKALPVLLQADYAFVGPNKSRIDLTGCFLIAKSTGNMSIERVEMQATKISCVAKSGRMFERKMNGFVADAKDNSFAVMGHVNSKQDRVAAMAFLSSVVEGVGKAIQQAQTTTQTNASGGSSSMITGNQGKYIAAGGVGNAASQVTQWYLKHAQNLLPTINVGSGQDVWIVNQDTIDLPNWYFREEKKKSLKKDFLYFSRFLDN
ncbi:MAG: hypothetical protein HOO06_09585 [Bdellovibrionaceae bacterium]|nr:hypothetical protein [Pseudobdellovibrionaceae bacterium]